MSKLKISASVLIVLFLFGVFSTSAFAIAPAQPKQLTATPVSETSIKVTWGAVTGATGYNVYWNDGLVVSNQNVLEYTATNLAPAEKYKFAIEAVNASSEKSELLVIDEILGLNVYPEKDTTDMTTINANQTGFGTATNDGTTSGSVIKSMGMLDNDGNSGTHRTHGDYQNNTNSCASCHQTHTASSKNLLFKNGVYNTCTACHDGTLGFYDVFATGENALNGAGTFGGTHEGNMSSHMANGTVAIKAAPGGNPNGTGTWIGDFTCASCHSAHGSFSDRLLNVNPNGMAQVVASAGGQLLEGVTVVSSLPDPGTGPNQVLLYEVIDAVNKETARYKNDDHAKVGNGALVLYVKKGTVYEPGILLSSGNSFTGFTPANAKYNPQNGYVTFTNVIADVSGVTAKIAQPYIIKLDLVDSTEPEHVALQASGIFIKKSNGPLLSVAGEGKKMSQYCSTCHTDYYAHSGGADGKWNTQTTYRHSTDSDSYTCVKCHFAHGTDVTIMRDALGKTVEDLVGEGMTEEKAKEYMLDNNPSSALKKFTNMSVCWACHNSSKSTQLINAPRDEAHPSKFKATKDAP